jgi:hypothetical protein
MFKVDKIVAWKLRAVKDGADPWYVKDIAEDETDSDEV